MAEWLRTLPEVAFALAILGVPGFVVALALRLKRWDATAFAVPLSLGVLTAANLAARIAHVRWGLLVIVATTVAAALACGLVGMFIRSRSVCTQTPELRPDTWSRTGRWLAGALTFAAALGAAWVAARGIGVPTAINQTYDGAFHVNSINLIAMRHSASPSVFGELIGNSGGSFYPPTFAAVASLLVTYAGVTPVVAANASAVAIAFLWPLTLSIALRRLARPSVFGYGVAMAGAVTVGLFPALLLSFGTLWPNALSFLALAPIVVVLARVSGLIGGADEPDVRAEIPWPTAVLVGAITALGLAYAHPGVIYLAFYLAMPLVIWLGWRAVGVDRAPWLRSNLTKSVAVVLASGILFEIVVEGSYRVSSIAALRRAYWPPLVSWEGALGQVLTLDTHLSRANLAMAALALVGLGLAWRSGRGRFLMASYLLIGTMAVLTAGVQTRITMHWTGFWYNDPYRIFAALPVIVLPLVALGSDGARRWISGLVGGLLERGSVRLPGRLTTAMIGGLVICVGVVALQGGLGTRKVFRVVASAYRAAPEKLVTKKEAELFERLATQIPDGMTIAGDPFSGAILAGTLSGHTMLYQTFRKPTEPDRRLVASRFRAFQRDPKVCAAVQRLRISVVIAGRRFAQETAENKRWYRGFTNLGHVRGLTLIDRGGGVQAFRVGHCNAEPKLSRN